MQPTRREKLLRERKKRSRKSPKAEAMVEGQSQGGGGWQKNHQAVLEMPGRQSAHQRRAQNGGLSPRQPEEDRITVKGGQQPQSCIVGARAKKQKRSIRSTSNEELDDSTTAEKRGSDQSRGVAKKIGSFRESNQANTPKERHPKGPGSPLATFPPADITAPFASAGPARKLTRRRKKSRKGNGQWGGKENETKKAPKKREQWGPRPAISSTNADEPLPPTRQRKKKGGRFSCVESGARGKQLSLTCLRTRGYEGKAKLLER